MPAAHLALAAVVAAGAPSPDVWYAPRWMDHGSTPSDYFRLLTAPQTAWPNLAKRSSTFKFGIQMLGPKGGNTDAELQALIATLQALDIEVGIEIGGARWGGEVCDAPSILRQTEREQKLVKRWLTLNGTVESATTDHAITWNIRGGGTSGAGGKTCVPAVPMATRIDVVAQVFASWRAFFGPNTSLGFIESLGYWDIDGPDGTQYTHGSGFDNITGYIPRLDDATSMLLAAAKKYNPDPSIPLIDHYQIDFGMTGVETDTNRFGAVPPVGMNYGRILGAEAVMKKHGLESGTMVNARQAAVGTNGCLVGCDPSFTPSHSAAMRVLNFTRGYMQLPNRASEYTLLEQFPPQQYPNVTGPETAVDTNMWMASQAAAVIKP